MRKKKKKNEQITVPPHSGYLSALELFQLITQVNVAFTFDEVLARFDFSLLF